MANDDQDLNRSISEEIESSSLDDFLNEDIEHFKRTGNRFTDSENIFDLLGKFNGYNPTRNALSSAYWGINQNAANVYTPIENNQYGLVFFTRPRLNLSYYNLIQDRVFTPLLTKEKKSVQSVVRAYLDPPGHRIRKEGSDMVDPNSPWIAMLSNFVQTLSGFPDPVYDSYTSKAGMYREELSMMDAIPVDFSAYDLTATFRNPKGNPVLDLFYVWERYAARVKEGRVNPYPENLFMNIIDYNTRIYSITLDETRRYITNIAACGAAYPTSINLGALSDYDRAKVSRDESDLISITFRCNGAMYRDPILMQEFNDVTCIFNQQMIGAENRKNRFVKLTPQERSWFTMEAIPWINLDTSELEWYVSKEQYNTVLQLGEIYSGYQKPGRDNNAP